MILKKTILFLLLSALFFACKKEDVATIKVKIKDSRGQYAVLYEQHVHGLKLVDSLKMRLGGQAKHQIKIRQTNFYKLDVGDEVSVSLIVAPGENIVIKGDAADFTQTKSITGSEGSVLINRLYDSLMVVRAQLNELKDQYQEAEDDSSRLKYSDDYEALVKAYRRYTMKFILDNPNSLASLAAIYQEFSKDDFVLAQKRDMQFYKILSDSLTKYYPKQRHVQSLKANFTNMHNAMISNQILSSSKAVVYDIPIVKLPNTRGDSISISQYKGKYVLVNFWASWNKESLQLLQAYKKVYDQHKLKDFVIYNVSFDKSMQSWQNVLNFEEINDWVNVSDTGFPNSQTRILYNITNIPTNYLVNPEQTEFVAKNLNPTDLGRKLSVLLD